MINVLNCKTWKIAIACAIQRFAIICSFRKVCNDIVCNYFVVQLLGLQFIRCHLDGRPKIEVWQILKIAKLWMAIYPPRIAPFGLKLGQNAFQTIPNISCFDVEQPTKFNIFGPENNFFVILAKFLRSYGQTDLKIRFGVKFCSRYTRPEVCATKNHENSAPVGFGGFRGL